MADGKDGIEQFWVEMPDDHEPGQEMEARTPDGHMVKFKVPLQGKAGEKFPVAYKRGKGGESPVDTDLMMTMETSLKKFGISTNKASDLLILREYDIIIIADDSGSMAKKDAGCTKTRWQELGESLQLVVSIGGCFDDDGLDIYFLNRSKVNSISGPDDQKLMKVMAEVPFDGGTPLSKALEQVVSDREAALRMQPDLAEKPVLLIIFTDGKPDEGPADFGNNLRNVLLKQRTKLTFRCQIMPCTGKDSDVAWIKTLDDELKELDATDDYITERNEMNERGVSNFTRGDWCMKAMLGAVSPNYDDPDKPTGDLDEATATSPRPSKSDLSPLYKSLLTMLVIVGLIYVVMSLRALSDTKSEL